MQHAKTANFSVFDAHDWRIGIVVAQFNRHITDQQYQSTLKMAKKYALPAASVTTIKVAGAMEIPLALQQLAKKTGTYQALLALGCVIRGDTPHFDYVCKLVTEGILRVELDYDQPIGFGILTCDDESQALARTRLAGDHLEAVLQLAHSIQG